MKTVLKQKQLYISALWLQLAKHIQIYKILLLLSFGKLQFAHGPLNFKPISSLSSLVT